MPLARDLHPEFGYVGSAPRLYRRLGLVSVFVAFGLVAGASGVAVFMAGSDPDPMNAMALASAEALTAPSPDVATPAQARVVEGQASPAGASRPPCRDYVFERFGDDCSSIRIHKPRSAPSLNERPAIAAVPIGHRDDPSVLPAPATIAAIPALPEVTAAPTDAGEAPAAAAPTAPAASVAKPVSTRARPARRESNSSRRAGYSSGRGSYSSGRSAGRAPGPGGWAGLW